MCLTSARDSCRLRGGRGRVMILARRPASAGSSASSSRRSSSPSAFEPRPQRAPEGPRRLRLRGRRRGCDRVRSAAARPASSSSISLSSGRIRAGARPDRPQLAAHTARASGWTSPRQRKARRARVERSPLHDSRATRSTSIACRRRPDVTEERRRHRREQTDMIRVVECSRPRPAAPGRTSCTSSEALPPDESRSACCAGAARSDLPHDIVGFRPRPGWRCSP